MQAKLAIVLNNNNEEIEWVEMCLGSKYVDDIGADLIMDIEESPLAELSDIQKLQDFLVKHKEELGDNFEDLHAVLTSTIPRLVIQTLKKSGRLKL